jgi:phosphatidylcholine synthase
VLTCLWLVSYAVLLTQLPDPSTIWLTISVAYVVYYVALSLYLTARRGRADRGGPTGHAAAAGQRAAATDS